MTYATVAAPSDGSDVRRPRIAVTLGDPAGVGPELAARLLARPSTAASADVVVLADTTELVEAATITGVSVPFGPNPGPDRVALLDDHSAGAHRLPVRQPSAAAGSRALYQLERALALAIDGEIDAIVFAPLNKTSLKLAGLGYADELRWFAHILGHDGFTSELNVLPSLTTARVTSHIALAEVPERVTTEAVGAAIDLLHRTLVDTGHRLPRIGVCALNPHAGENGAFGHEEIERIAPAVDAARRRGLEVSGPFPCDTIFATRRHNLDGIVTMYHDQGQIAMKLLGFDEGVTVEGGLPVVITTPAHGTAFDITGEGVADPGPMEHAFDLAVRLAHT